MTDKFQKHAFEITQICVLPEDFPCDEIHCMDEQLDGSRFLKFFVTFVYSCVYMYT